MKSKLKDWFIELFILLIITVPAFLALLNLQYFSMHDDQHIARLYLLFEGLKQGQIFPRWVDMLGFGFGYPLYNFYPPLIYYVSAGFHVLGFSLILSIKLMIITGFIFAALGSYLLIKEMVGKLPGLLGATVYTYFFYHAENAYVRGAFAEFFSMAILPFVFLGAYKISKQFTLSSVLLFAISYALLILTHPLIAFPCLIFIGAYFIYSFLFTKHKVRLITFFSIAGLIALGLSAFFWMPSMTERKFTLVDQILTKELANYKDHYIYPQQLWYSPWGYGGSVKGTGDGMTFQLGKVNILFILGSMILGIAYILKKKEHEKINDFYIYLLLFFGSLFLTTSYSSFVWNYVQFLSYMQFPWRMLTFTGLFISVVIGFGAYFFYEVILKNRRFIKYKKIILSVMIILSIGLIVFKYAKYFYPQRYINTNDTLRTSYTEIAWRISSTSFEFVPKTVQTVKSRLNTTRLAINKNQLPRSLYQIIIGKAQILTEKHLFAEKSFTIIAESPIEFRLNTYNFPGWKAYVDGVEAEINDNNRLKLITINVPQGKHTINFKFEDTLIRKIGNSVSIIFLFITMLCLYSLFRKKSLKVKK